MGPESVGKSVLIERLSNFYETNFVEEYGKTFYEKNDCKITIEDFITISNGRQDIEDRLIKDSNKILLCDTEDITTYLFSKMFFPDEYKKVEEYFLDSISSKPQYDLYILLTPDCDFVQDGLRSFQDNRWEHYDCIKYELLKYKCNFIEIGGDWDNRYNESVKLIDSHIFNRVK